MAALRVDRRAAQLPVAADGHAPSRCALGCGPAAEPVDVSQSSSRASSARTRRSRFPPVRSARGGYTSGMKTAVSIPDDVFKEAEHLAKHLKVSRSELYAKALAEFVSRHSPDAVTDSFNRVLAEINEDPDPAFQRAARSVLEKSEW